MPRITLPTLKVLNALLAAQHAELSGADVAQSTGLASGTLYPILIRLEHAGWLQSRWEEIEPRDAGRPRRRLYKVTGLGAASARSAFSEIAPPQGFETAWAR